MSFLGMFSAGVVVLGQTPIMVKDINLSGNSNPEQFFIYDGRLYFGADDGSNGRELWLTDGSTSGTKMVKDINPSGNSNPFRFIQHGGDLFFVAQDEFNNEELRITDGTTSNTQLLKDIDTSGGSNPGWLKSYNGRIYFQADDGATGNELWVSDGTTSGTYLFKDIDSSGGGTPNGFTKYDGKLYFNAKDSIDNFELWETDGTVSGTQMVKDINPSAGSSPNEFTHFNGRLYFEARNDTSGYELWTTDGTSSGTHIVKDINASGTGNPYGITLFDGKLYFNAENGTNGRELWISDGTSSGTHMVKDINPTGSSVTSFPPKYDLTAYAGRLYFRAKDGSNGIELWSTDGTATGTNMVRDINSNGDSNPKGFIVYNEKLYFSAVGDSLERQLWSYNAQTDSLALIAPSLPPKTDALSPYASFITWKQALYFSANYTSSGFELYKIDTATNTNLDNKLTNTNIKVYPNPTNNQAVVSFTINEPSSVEIEVLDLNGRKLTEVKADGKDGLLLSGRHQEQIDLTDLPQGIYLISVTTSQQSHTHPIMKH